MGDSVDEDLRKAIEASRNEMPLTKLKARTQARVSDETVRLMVTLRDWPRELRLQQQILGKDDKTHCFHCGGKGHAGLSGGPERQPTAAEMLARNRKAMWLYQEKSGGWARFDSAMARTLNDASAEGVGAAVYVRGRGFEYTVDLGTMVQENMKTATKRKVLRILDPDAVTAMEKGGGSSCSAASVTERASWSFGSGSGNWVAIAEHMASTLEAAWASHQAGTLDNVVLTLRSGGQMYDFDIAAMTQTNNKTRRVRLLRREASAPPADTNEVAALRRVPSGRSLPPGICWVCRGDGLVSQCMNLFEGADKWDAEDFEGHDCLVCYGPAVFRMSTTCDHFFCETCIRMSIEAMMETGQFPAFCPMCRADAGGKELKRGRVSDASLTFLQQRGVITKPLQFRLEKQQNKALGIDEVNVFECPGKCGEFLLSSHSTYEAAKVGEVFTDPISGEIGVRLGVCPSCGTTVCTKCETRVEADRRRRGPPKALHRCDEIAKKLSEAPDPETLAMCAKIGKKCPACGMFIQKVDGCQVMMCGTTAHGKVADALRNGGCAFIFDWNTLKKIRDDHGYTDIKGNWVKGDGPVTDRQVLLKK
eukprot:TRINITY_DN68346_c0_g1_i1.p1 TRINITY_DN68346_c0_g1~~TRINITY_DN68346_c0_g1_i1.p1  ORF type:complete len:591 (-),score=98.89 TRINITY_DN68346_c0_g1_i1:54-1826(-)